MVLNVFRPLVFILLGYGSSIRQIMLNMYDVGMITSQYAYFTFEITPDNCKGDDGRDEAACEAFEGIMDISSYIPSTQEYKAFETKVRQKMPQFAGLEYHMRPNDEVRLMLYNSSIGSDERVQKYLLLNLILHEDDIFQ